MLKSDQSNQNWPEIPFEPWQETCTSLHLWSQIVGKYRLSHTPWLNHSWHATLYVCSEGLTTGPVYEPGGVVTVTFDFSQSRLVVKADRERQSGFTLEAMSVASFFAKMRVAIEEVGGTFNIHRSPNELPDVIPFTKDTDEREYDGEAVGRFHAALLKIVPVFEQFRTGFLGKVSPVHLFWGSFDLALTRFSGRDAPLHPGGFPNLPDSVTREAYSHEVSSAGFWPGNGGAGEAMFYSYASPPPDGMAAYPVKPEQAYWDKDLGEFLLPYEAVRTSDNPQAVLMEFLQSTYEAAAETAGWNRQDLECSLQEAGIPRVIETAK